MKNLKKFLALCLLASFAFFTSCSEDVTVDMQENSKLAIQKSDLADRMEMFNYFKSKHEAGEDVSKELTDYILANRTTSGADQDYFTRQVLAAINPDDYTCEDTTALDVYVNSTIDNWTFIDYLYWLFFGDYPVYDAIYFKDPTTERQVYGVNGEFTNQLNRTFKDLKRFWNIYSDDILMVAMKGDTYKDVDRLFLIDGALYPGQTDEETLYWATLFNEFFTSDAFWGGDHPLLSFNAFALSTTDSFIQDRIVMGDGIMTAYDAIGMGDAAPQAILAHEFAHHIQFENGYFNIDAPSDPAEATRRTELMADAYAAYYLTHKRGATMNWWRVQQFLDAFFNIGDCGFSSSGHHGTHAQRLAAAEWGYNLAKSAQKNGHILTSQQVYGLFQASLDDIINCDNCVATAD